jgi:hypothetical protein
MWPIDFNQRLTAWAKLKETAQNSDIEQALAQINSWWFESPWQPYYLHWDDIQKWPDPWQLLEDNIYCDVARGLGIVYTVSMLDRPDITANLVLTEDNFNLVQVNDNKYVLNIDRDIVVNTKPISSKRKLTQQEIHQRYN